MLDALVIGKATDPVYLLPSMANRHGLIAGATGTGKTVTLQMLAESFSRIGVPVFSADIKGDLSGISLPGAPTAKITGRAHTLGLEGFALEGAPVVFWDVFARDGHPVRTTVSDMGPLVLSRLLNLNETQQGVLSLVFRVADDRGWLLLDLKDLRAMLKFVADHRAEFKTLYGNVSTASVGAIQRRIIVLEDQGGTLLFGEPDLVIDDIMQTDEHGRGIVNILAAEALMRAPQIYSALLLWLLSELFEHLPEVGDRDKPRLVLFFDEAHLLFDRAPKALLDRIEQAVRLIRSKGVGIYFVTQSPLDIPETVLGQLGNRIQHALRAFTPKDQRAVRSAADTFRPNPELDTAQVITELEVGEALVSTLGEKGDPGIVQRTLIAPPRSQIGPIDASTRNSMIVASTIYGTYEKIVDRESAYEILRQRGERAATSAAQKRLGPRHSEPQEATPGVREHQSTLETFARSAARSIGTQLGKQLARGLLGSLFGARR